MSRPRHYCSEYGTRLIGALICTTICGIHGGGGKGSDCGGGDDGGGGGSSSNSNEQVESVAMYEEAVSSVRCGEEYLNRRAPGAAANYCRARGTVVS